MGDRHQREKCLSCVAVAASGGNQPVTNLNPLAVGRANEADAAYCSAVRLAGDLVVAERPLVPMLIRGAQEPADGSEVALRST